MPEPGARGVDDGDADPDGPGVGAIVGSVADGMAGRTESRGLVRGLLMTTPTTLNAVKSTNGRMLASLVNCPAVPDTLTTSPTGTPGTYGRPPCEPKVTSASEGFNRANGFSKFSCRESCLPTPDRMPIS